jgi:hypothetical protein
MKIVKSDQKIKYKKVEAFRAFADNKFEEVISIIESISSFDRDIECELLLAQSYFKKGSYVITIRLLEKSLGKHPENSDIIRLLINCFEENIEYKRALHYLDYLATVAQFKIDDIIQLLRLCRLSGLYEKGLGVLKYLTENKLFSEELIVEEVLLKTLALGWDEHDEIRSKYPELSKKFSLLYKRLKREHILKGRTCLQGDYYRAFGKVLLGSYSDNGYDISDTSLKEFDVDHLYETCLRFVEFSQSFHMRWDRVTANGLENTYFGKLIGFILDIPFVDFRTVLNSNTQNTLLVSAYFDCGESQLLTDCTHFALSSKYAFHNVEQPDFCGVIVSKKPGFKGLRNKYSEEELFEVFKSKKHHSSLSWNGYAFWNTVTEYSFMQPIASISTSKFQLSKQQDIDIEKELNFLKDILDKEGLLYIKPVLDKFSEYGINNELINYLFALHKQHGFEGTEIPRFCSSFDMNQTYEWYKHEYSLADNKENLLKAVAAIPHQDTINILKEYWISEQNSPLQCFFSSGTYLYLQCEKFFGKILSKGLEQEYICSLVSSFVYLTKMNPDWTELILDKTKNLDTCTTKYVFKKMYDNHEIFDFPKILSKLDELPLDPYLLKLLRLHGVSIPEQKRMKIKTLGSNDLILFIKEYFEFSEFLLEISESEREQINKCFLNALDAEDVFESFQDKLFMHYSASKYQKDFERWMVVNCYPLMCDLIFSSFERKQYYKSDLSLNISQWSVIKKNTDDIRFLMDTENAYLRTKVAGILFGAGEADYFEQLLADFEKYGQQVRVEIIRIFLRNRFDAALQLLAVKGLREGYLSSSSILSLLFEISSNPVLIDEWKSTLRAGVEKLTKYIKDWLFDRVQSEFQQIILYNDLFNDICWEDLIEESKKQNTFSREIYSFLIMESPKKGKEYLEHFEADDRDLFLLKKLH